MLIEKCDVFRTFSEVKEFDYSLNIICDFWKVLKNITLKYKNISRKVIYKIIFGACIALLTPNIYDIICIIWSISPRHKLWVQDVCFYGEIRYKISSYILPSRHTTLKQRWFNIDSALRSWINVESMLFQQCLLGCLYASLIWNTVCLAGIWHHDCLFICQINI